MKPVHQLTSREFVLPTGPEIKLLILGMKSDDDLRRRLALDLHELVDLVPIEHAHISLERQHDAMPPFQAAVMLVVPGPDIYVAARDHTWPAAWHKVLKRLHERIAQMRAQMAKRRRGQPPAAPPGQSSCESSLGPRIEVLPTGPNPWKKQSCNLIPK